MNTCFKIILLFFFYPAMLVGQMNVDSVLAQIEKNNTSLAVLRKNAEAEKIGNKTGMYLPNPELGFNYLWSDPTNIGNRTDINLRQTFDFPTVYGHRKQISDFRDIQVDLDYQGKRKEMLFDARLLCLDIVHANALLEELRNRLLNARELANAYQKLFDTGESGLIEYNNVMLNLLNAGKELESVQIEKDALLKQLKAMNGGISIELDISDTPVRQAPADFDQWFGEIEQINPELLWLNQQVELSLQQERLNRALTLPKASAGYMSENRTGEHFQGITLGVSIPMWENRNIVKYSQVSTLAWQNTVFDYKIQFYNQLKIQYDKAVHLQKLIEDYRQNMDLYQNVELLKKALEKGEISVVDYLVQLSLTYSTIDNFLQLRKDYDKSIATLYQIEE